MNSRKPLRTTKLLAHSVYAGLLIGLLTLAASLPVSAALRAHYQLNETSGTTVGAAIGPAGSLAGSGSTWTSGILNNALGFSGSGNAYFEDDPALEGSGGNNITVSFWFYNPSSLSQLGAVILQKGYLGGITYGFRVDSTGAGIDYVRDRAQGGNYLRNSGALSFDTWHNVVGVFNRDQPVADSTAANLMQLFVDGKSIGTRSSSGNLTNNTARLTIGAQDAGSGSFNQLFQGSVDDVGIWDECVTFRKIASINGLGRFEGLDLGSAQLDQFVTAFDTQGSIAINGNTWQYTTGLSGVLGAIGGTAGVDAFIVLDATSNGMITVVPEPGTLALGILGGLTAALIRRRK